MHLLVAISSHGYGHAAQVVPVLNALCRQRQDLRLTLMSSLPERFFRERLQCAFTRIDEAPDFGLVMNSALSIDLDASAAAYRRLHADWDRTVAALAQRLRTWAPDLVLADVPYLTLAASSMAGIPAVALCSLNWADIYAHYFSDRAEAADILRDMRTAYAGARAFLCPEPSMPMPFLSNRRALGPISVRGRDRRTALRRGIGIGAECLLILVAPGGVPARFPMEDWPAGQGIHWLVEADWQVDHPDVSSIQQTGLSVPDLFASCDAVLGKCGYGTVTECVVNATPLLYVPRPDWPEEGCLLAWLEAHQAALEVAPARLRNGVFSDLLAPLRAVSVRAVEPIGAAQAATYLQTVIAEIVSP